jgi:1-acyl-sn-glycerol-3-phosphate acyltransferase
MSLLDDLTAELTATLPTDAQQPHLALVPDAALPAVDAGRLEKVRTLLEVVLRVYHRVEASGEENFPESGALIVGNHSGGIIAMDAPIIALSYWKRFGVRRPLRVLAHDVLMAGPIGEAMKSVGFLQASRENADAALREGGATIVFPGGDYDVYRPTSARHVIDFAGRVGYVRTAIKNGVPIVPVVSIGGQETQIVLSRGETIAKYNPINKVVRSKFNPITLGFPWGVTMGLPQLPLPSKIVTRILAPVDPADFDNDVEAVDREVRARMQQAMDELAAARRFPVIG